MMKIIIGTLSLIVINILLSFLWGIIGLFIWYEKFPGWYGLLYFFIPIISVIPTIKIIKKYKGTTSKLFPNSIQNAISAERITIYLILAALTGIIVMIFTPEKQKQFPIFWFMILPIACGITIIYLLISFFLTKLFENIINYIKK